MSAPGRAPVRLSVLLVMIASGTILMPLNSVMLVVALPRIMAEFSISISTATWLMTGYLIAFSAVQPICGRLGDMYGHQRLFQIGVLCFAGASLVCALAPNFPALLFGRMLQAAAGSAMVPNGFTIIRYQTAPATRGRAMGLLGGCNATAAAISPAIGGFLVQMFDWQAIFYVNLVIIAIGLTLATLVVGRITTPMDKTTRFDNLGSALLGLFSISLTLGISATGNREMVGFSTWWLFAAAAVSITLFLAQETRARAPLVRLSLFRVRNYVASMGCSFFINLTMFGLLILIPMIFQEVLRYSTSRTGLLLLVFSGVMALTAPLGGSLSDRLGRRLIPLVGASLLIIGSAAFLAINAASGLTLVLLCLLTSGAGYGLIFPVLQTIAIESSPLETSAVAIGVYLMVRYIGAAVGTSLAGGFTIEAAMDGAAAGFHQALLALVILAVPALLFAIVIRPRSDSGA